MKKSKYRYLSLIVIVLLFNLTGCSQIPFEKFILGEDAVSDIKIPYLNIEKININTENINTFQEISNNLFNTIGNKEYYYDNYSDSEIYLRPVKNLFEENFYNQLINNEVKNDFKKMIDNIYYKDNMYYDNSKVIEAGINSDGEHFFVTEIVSIGDSKDFMVSSIRIYLNENNKIIKSEIISEDTIIGNTSTPLSKDSLISENLSKEKEIITTFLNSMKSNELYNMVSNNKPEATLQLDTLINNINISIKSPEDLKMLFKAGKGTFENYYITKYTINDKDCMANSEFVLSFVNGSQVDDFTFIYSRITNEIINIKKK